MSPIQPSEGIVARLRTLGALELTGPDGAEASSILARQRRAALLVYLALEAGDSYVRRDALFTVFWPEMDEARARAALRQALYVLRSELGVELVTARGDDDVGVSRDLVCDAVTFNRLADEGKYADALAQYRGDFLSGFHIPDAQEFEEWVGARRTMLKRRALECARALGAQCSSNGDADGAVRAYRRAVELEPTDERAVASLMVALDAAGERAAALRQFENLVTVLDRDLGIAPSAETRAAAEAIRDGRRPATPASATGAQAPAAGIAAEGPRTALAPAVPARRRANAIVLSVAAVVVVLMALFAQPWKRAAVPDTPDEPLLAVLPFTVRGGPELAYLGEGMADMLSTSLDGQALFRSVPPSAVVRDVRARGTALDDPEAARAVARRFGAERYVVGSVVGVGDQLRLDVRLFGAGSSPLAQVSVSGNPDSVFLLVDRVAAELIGNAPGSVPADRLRRSAALTTQSLAALRDYLLGERALRDGDFERAREHYRRAVSTDTGFALAYYRMSMAETWIGEAAGARGAAEVARRHATRLSAPNRALLTAHNDMLSGRSDSAEAGYRAVLLASPDDPEAWLQLGELLYHHNPVRGRPIEESRDAFLRVLSYDPRQRASLVHMVRIAATMRDTTLLDSLAARFEASGVTAGLLGSRLVQASVHGDRAAIASLARGATSELPEEISDAARAALMHGRDAEAALTILAANLSSARPPERHALTRYQMAAIELLRGRDGAAQAHFAAAARLFPTATRDLSTFYRLRSIVPPDRAELAAIRDRLLPASRDRLGSAARVQLLATMVRLAPVIRLGLLSEVSGLLGDAEAAARYLRELEASLVPPEDDEHKQALIRDLRAASALRAGRAAEAASLLAVRRNADVSLGAVGLPWTATSRVNAGLALAATGRASQAPAWLESLEHQSVFLYPFLGPATLELARIRERAGDRAGAQAAYQRVADLWSGADERYRPARDEALARLSALSRR
jgi:DNA-binding SARP family transcriptional activator/TolB-like protein